ncbi:hypothetical protein Dtox_0389 [Desulfofarcimen acetoxidans DSM 771]|uniref:Uncharacterized protein n=1 Tax=Desulfofarcimen acetoxidans (strain ATCC 49208 / DSM 771 / KCTC 5769 / VKM B-1644 / 5575) TaxID=485916 RepID=C8W4Y2_DESAS|nr:hypothetical protein [Desulfofarcimen acetoxidans]ACV61334.1 hypothetical protein Dtox_0389 [Desulfofarcimen acetoxidans DSM 771]
MKKKKMFIILGIMVLLLAGISNYSFGGSKYSPKEHEVQQQVIDTFDLANDLKSNALRPQFMRDIYDDEIATESKEIRSKVALAILSLQKEKEFSEGDFKPMIFLNKGNDKALIAVKHSDNTIILYKFDISKGDKPLKLDEQVKDVKVDRGDK